jgi:hypothetical protein
MITKTEDKLMDVKINSSRFIADLKGRVTKPEAGLDDKQFKYVPAINTNLADTFAKVFGQMGERKKEKV